MTFFVIGHHTLILESWTALDNAEPALEMRINLMSSFEPSISCELLKGKSILLKNYIHVIKVDNQ